LPNLLRSILAITVVSLLLAFTPAAPSAANNTTPGSSGGGEPPRGSEEGPDETAALGCNPNGTLNFPFADILTTDFRFGTIFTPANDSFVGTTTSTSDKPRSVYFDGTPDPITPLTGSSYAPKFTWRTSDKTEVLRIQAHWWQPHQGNVAASEARVHLWSPKNQAIIHTFKPNLNLSISPFKCYKNFPNVQNLGYLETDIVVPKDMAAEPGFNIRVEIREISGLNIQLRGADQNFVHIGLPPNNANEPITAPDSALGLIMDDGALIDVNGEPDDLTSILTPSLINSSLVQGFLVPALNGRSISFSNDDNTIVFNADISGFNATLADYDLNIKSIRPRTVFAPPSDQITFQVPLVPVFPLFLAHFIPITLDYTPPRILIDDVNASPDDEGALSLKVNVNLSGQIDGRFTVYKKIGPLDIGATIPFRATIRTLSLSATVSAVFDRSADQDSIAVRASVDDINLNGMPDMSVEIMGIEVPGSDENVTAVKNFLRRNFRYIALSIAQNPSLSATLHTAVNDTLDGLLETATGGLAAGPISLPAGKLGFNIFSLYRTCVRLGCDGGDILLAPDGGLEIALEAAALGPDPQKIRPGAIPVAANGKFPKVYRPSTLSAVPGLLDRRISPRGTHFDVGAIVDAGFVNQIQRVLAAGGMLDISNINLSSIKNGLIFPETAPIFFGSADRFNLLILNARLQSPEYEFSVDLGVNFGLSLTDSFEIKPSAAITLSRLEPLWCVSQNWCGFLSTGSAGYTELLNFIRNNIVNPLLEKAFGIVKLPTFGDIRIHQADLGPVDGHVGMFVDIEAKPRLTASAARIGRDDVVFKAEFVPKRLEPSFNWTIYNKNGDVVASGSGPEIWVSRYDIIDEDDGWMPSYRAMGIVTATTSDGKTYSAQAHIAFREKNT
jgi:hypothetical protein